jgi:peptidoglycan hydrolase-like protein with peptidoglycan-binding domain
MALSVLGLGSISASATGAPTQKVATTSTSANSTVSNLVILSPDFNYGPDGGPDIWTIIYGGEFVERGDVGKAVKELQSYLNAMDDGPAGGRSILSPNYVDVDGYFGPATENEVKWWQSYWGITADGIVGPETYSYIMGALI